MDDILTSGFELLCVFLLSWTLLSFYIFCLTIRLHHLCMFRGPNIRLQISFFYGSILIFFLIFTSALWHFDIISSHVICTTSMWVEDWIPVLTYCWITYIALALSVFCCYFVLFSYQFINYLCFKLYVYFGVPSILLVHQFTSYLSDYILAVRQSFMVSLSITFSSITRVYF